MVYSVLFRISVALCIKESWLPSLGIAVALPLAAAEVADGEDDVDGEDDGEEE